VEVVVWAAVDRVNGGRTRKTREERSGSSWQEGPSGKGETSRVNRVTEVGCRGDGAMQTRRWDGRRKRVEKAAAIVNAILTRGYFRVFQVWRTGTSLSDRAIEMAGACSPIVSGASFL